MSGPTKKELQVLLRIIEGQAERLRAEVERLRAEIAKALAVPPVSLRGELASMTDEEEVAWILWFEDASARPEVFAGCGAEAAARAAFESARQNWTVRLFREVRAED